MSTTFPYPLMAALLCLSAGAAHADAADCSEVRGWSAGRQEQAAEAPCASNDAYMEAHRLGTALSDLHSRHADLEARIAAEPERAGALRRQQRQIGVDIEAIQGIATLRDWPIDPSAGNPP